MAFNTVEWAYRLRGQLRSEIRRLTRSNSSDRDYEAIGLLGETDRLRDLKRRLGQVERLIEAIEPGGGADKPDGAPPAEWAHAEAPDDAAKPAARAH